MRELIFAAGLSNLTTTELQSTAPPTEEFISSSPTTKQLALGKLFINSLHILLYLLIFNLHPTISGISNLFVFVYLAKRNKQTSIIYNTKIYQDSCQEKNLADAFQFLQKLNHGIPNNNIHSNNIIQNTSQ